MQKHSAHKVHSLVVICCLVASFLGYKLPPPGLHSHTKGSLIMCVRVRVCLNSALTGSVSCVSGANVTYNVRNGLWFHLTLLKNNCSKCWRVSLFVPLNKECFAKYLWKVSHSKERVNFISGCLCSSFCTLKLDLGTGWCFLGSYW